MPTAKRRKTSSGPTASAKSQQSTLSFRATKAGARKADKDVKAAKSEVTDDVDDSVVDIPTSVPEPKPVEVEVEEPTEGVVDEPSLDEEEEARLELEKSARALPETKIKSYWAAKERERKAPRVHQEGLSVREKILREFDLSSRYGPSVGIQRLSRWRRAHALGMDPPIEILAVLLKEMDSAEKAKSQNKKDVQRSIIDDLTLSSRLKGDGLEV